MHADEHDALEAHLAVLDLGDVLELGGQALDAPQRLALLALELQAVAVVEVGGVVLEGEGAVPAEAGDLGVRGIRAEDAVDGLSARAPSAVPCSVRASGVVRSAVM